VKDSSLLTGLCVLGLNLWPLGVRVFEPVLVVVVVVVVDVIVVVAAASAAAAVGVLNVAS
jgi:hypothetical protein